MRAVVFTSDKMLNFASFDNLLPSPGKGLLEVKTSGLRGSDLKFYRAPLKTARALWRPTSSSIHKAAARPLSFGKH